jgi:cytoskeletal protein RodZ
MREITRRPSAVTALTALAAVAALTLAGCGGGDDSTGSAGGEQTSSPSASASASESASESPSGSASESASESPSDDATDDSTDAPGDVETDDGAVEIEVEIENGQVTPSGERVDVKIGEPIRFVVDSDAADELHVHSTPTHTFRVKPGDDDKQFEFTLNQPGVVEVELHELGDVVVSLAARP